MQMSVGVARGRGLCNWRAGEVYANEVMGRQRVGFMEMKGRGFPAWGGGHPEKGLLPLPSSLGGCGWANAAGPGLTLGDRELPPGQSQAAAWPDSRCDVCKHHDDALSKSRAGRPLTSKIFSFFQSLRALHLSPKGLNAAAIGFTWHLEEEDPPLLCPGGLALVPSSPGHRQHPAVMLSRGSGGVGR